MKISAFLISVKGKNYEICSSCPSPILGHKAKPFQADNSSTMSCYYIRRFSKKVFRSKLKFWKRTDNVFVKKRKKVVPGHLWPPGTALTAFTESLLRKFDKNQNKMNLLFHSLYSFISTFYFHEQHILVRLFTLM